MSAEAGIDAIAAKDPHFRAIHLSRNFGHQAAVTAGLHPTGTVNAGTDWCAQRLIPPKSARR